MTDPTKIRAYVADLDDLGTAFSTITNPLKDYIDAIAGGGTGINQTKTIISTPGQATFDTSPVRTDLMLVFIGGAYQPDPTYTIDSLHQITFDDPLIGGLNVHFVERKLAGTTKIPGGAPGQILTKYGVDDGQYSWEAPPVPEGGDGSPGTTIALAHYSVSSGVITEDFDVFGNMVASRASAGNFTVTLTGVTFPTNKSYVVDVICDEDASASIRSVRILNRTATGFDIKVENQSGTAVDPDGMNIIVSGSPTITPTNIISAPVGMISFYAASTPPVGYLVCNGAAVSRVAYAALFHIIGTTFGIGDGVTTFNLPDLRGRFIRGWNQSAADDNTHDEEVARGFGTYQTDDNKAHTHMTSISSVGGGYDSGTHHYPKNYTTGAGDFLTSSTGTESRPRNVALLPCIKAIPDLNSYAAVQRFESFTVSAIGGQSTFNTLEVDTRYAYVFVDGAYQPPSEYSTPTSNSVEFPSSIPHGSVVDIVKIYAASTPAASKSSMISASNNDVMVTPASIKDSPFVAKAWGRVTNPSSSTPTLFGYGLSVTRVSTGSYQYTISPPMTSANYATIVTAEQDTETDSRICIYIYGKTASGFCVNSQTANGMNVDKAQSVLVFGIQ